ncbi:MAG: thioredoxin family protein [Verrucomicrobiota bacterium]
MKLIPDATSFETEVLNHPGTVLVDFYTDRCTYCRMMAPVLEEAAQERSDLKFVQINAAENHELAARYRVIAAPTFVLLTNGEVRGQFSGTRTKKQLLNWIESSR